MVEAISQFFAGLPDTSKAAIVASIVTLTGVILSAIAALVGVWITHRGNEKRFGEQLRYDRQQRRIERRAEIVAELYSKLIELKKSASEFVRWYNSVDIKRKKQYLEKLWRSADALDAHFDRHRIYLDQSICMSIEAFRKTLSEASSVLATFVHDANAISVTDGQVFEEWKKADAVLETEVPKITGSLEETFRRLLDLEESK